jgi:conjugative relaxase-like TrwC/TraI family protein
MSLARLSAGSGYRYLLRHTACGDACRVPGRELTAYYAATGYPAGRWLGQGLAGLNDGLGLAENAIVVEQAMAALYGRGHDPVSGKPLGAAYPRFKSVEERVAEALADLPDTLADDEVEARRVTMEQTERARPTREAVAGFDLTFTMPKSASVLWALGDEDVRTAIAGAHRDTVTRVLQLIEDRFLFTRVGPQGCAQVATRGMVAAAFDHWDTRIGDPNLHTHVVIANKVQGPDGKWRSLDSRVLHHAAVALSEVYDDLIADAIAGRLPVTWSWRFRGERRSPAFEIDGLSDDLLAAFSRRSGQVAAAMRGLTEEFRARHHREPTRREVLRMRQQATLATRPDKTVRPLTELLDRWRSTARQASGQDVDRLLSEVIAEPKHGVVDRPTEVGPLTATTLAGVAERRSTWTRANLLAEAARATRHLRAATPEARLALLDQVVEAALSECVPLDPPDLFATPRRFTRADGTSAFARPEEAPFTTTSVLDAEQRLQAAMNETGAPSVGPATLDTVIEAARIGMPGARGLSADQADAVTAIATTARRLEVLVGPAGSGKTRTLRALRVAWEREHGPGSVVGLAASAVASAELSVALAIPCENTAKWLHESSSDDSPRWAMQVRQLVIVDEASMVTTADLDQLLAQAQAAGAKLLLVGDNYQLDPVGAGGAFGLLTESTNAQFLTSLWRFRNRWEANATRALRLGDPVAIDAYAAHARLNDGPSELMLDAAYVAWTKDTAAGRAAVLLAADRATVLTLNTRAHDDRVAAGIAQEDGIVFADDTTGGRGDVVVTRRNNRTLRHAGGYVRNGDLWRITDVHPDGAVDVVAFQQGEQLPPVLLPADYVRDHVELGYASTVHRAQGMTVDCGHVVATSAMSRQSLYVAMTRGREANHAYVATDRPAAGGDGICPAPTETEAPTGHEVLRTILAADRSELSATATLRQRHREATSLRRLLPIRDFLREAAGDPEAATAVAEIDQLLRARAVAARGESTRGRISEPSPRVSQEGIYR